MLIVIAAMARTPEEKCGTIEIMRTLRGEPGGMNPDYLAMKRIMRPTLPYQYDTPQGNFKIHYTLTGGDAIDSLGYAIKIGEYMERCWSVYADSFGYIVPPNDGTLGGDARYDVYLRNISAYGLTYPGTDGGQPWDDLTSYIELDNDYSAAYPNDDPDGPVAGAMRVTAAHELHHAFQFGLYGSCASWIAEMSSVSMEERMYPLVNDYIWLLDYLFDDPQLSIAYEFGYHMYGMGLYAEYWNMVYGDDFLATVWDTMRFIPNEEAVYAACDVFGTSLLADMADFAATALFVGSRDCGFYPDGAAMSDMEVAHTHSTYPASGGASPQPYGYGMNFIIFENFGVSPVDLRIDFDGADGVEWGVRAVWKDGDSIAVFNLTVAAFAMGSVVVPFVNEAEMVGLAIIPGGEFASRYNFSYSAEIQPAGITEHSMPEEIEIRAFPNPFNSSCRIEVSDSIGEIRIYDIRGELAHVLHGPEFVWDGKDMNGKPLSNGTYLIRGCNSGSFAKVVLME